MTSLSDLGFPENIRELMYETLHKRLPEHKVFKRPIRMSDPARCCGVFALNWTPDESDYQTGQEEPITSMYHLRVQNLVKSSNEEHGLRHYAVDAKMVRAILYRDPTLRVGLEALTSEVLGSVERFLKFGIRSQSFLNNELSGQFVYLVTTEVWVETETMKL